MRVALKMPSERLLLARSRLKYWQTGLGDEQCSSDFT